MASVSPWTHRQATILAFAPAAVSAACVCDTIVEYSDPDTVLFHVGGVVVTNGVPPTATGTSSTRRLGLMPDTYQRAKPKPGPIPVAVDIANGSDAMIT